MLCVPAFATSLPLPRWASLKSDEINARTGPGTRYPIAWVYHRAEMPVEIVEEFGQWRKIRDAEGTAGWVHESMLGGRRYVVITGKEAHVVRFDPSAGARPMLKVDPRVIARLAECKPHWCRIQVAGRKGWIEKQYLWGVYPKEIIE
ncbi:MAG: hypothetical protein KGJ21_10540 [Pseudomonadota bacterium]|nr:hypothetical protein [Pseudomonadota bacterium]